MNIFATGCARFPQSLPNVQHTLWIVFFYVIETLIVTQSGADYSQSFVLRIVFFFAPQRVLHRPTDAIGFVFGREFAF